jgi:hypothetical protein
VLTFRRGIVIVGVLREWWQRRDRQRPAAGFDHRRSG